MIIIGELINTSRKSIAAMVKEQDQPGIQKVACDQSANGANYIDVNAGTFVDSEAERLKWLITTVQSKTDCSCCIDSPNPQVLEEAIALHRNGTPMINSITAEQERMVEERQALEHPRAALAPVVVHQVHRVEVGGQLDAVMEIGEDAADASGALGL